MFIADFSKLYPHCFGGKHWERLQYANKTFPCIIYKLVTKAILKQRVQNTALTTTSVKYCLDYHSNCKVATFFLHLLGGRGEESLLL